MCKFNEPPEELPRATNIELIPADQGWNEHNDELDFAQQEMEQFIQEMGGWAGIQQAINEMQQHLGPVWEDPQQMEQWIAAGNDIEFDVENGVQFIFNEPVPSDEEDIDNGEEFVFPGPFPSDEEEQEDAEEENETAENDNVED